MPLETLTSLGALTPGPSASIPGPPRAARPPAGTTGPTPGPSSGPQPPEPSLLEWGTSGTAIFGQGYIRELGEYNPEFSGGPFTSYREFEKMRRGDGQVAGTLMTVKTPIRCAEWTIRPPKDPTPVEKECAEFCESVLFDDLDFDRALENLLLALDFGAACHEEIWTVTNGQVRLARLAPRLPLTFYTWTVDANEQLQYLIQHGFHLGFFQRFPLPADKICLYTYRQEGANYAGRALLREMYPHWFVKSGLIKIDAIACERNGMGVPVGELAPGATKEDRATFEKFLQSLAVHESAYLMLPSGAKFTLQGVTGQTRNCWESIQQHNIAISMSALTQFTNMGQSSRGGGANRSLGETMSDFFYLAEQAAADQIGDAFSAQTIRRLALYNYGPKVRSPKLVPQQIITLKFEAVTEALAKLATAKILIPDPDMESWLRQKMGAPAIDRAELVRMRQALITTAPLPGAPAGATPAAVPAKPSDAAQPAAPAKPSKIASSDTPTGETVSAADLSPEPRAAPLLSRPPRGPEKFLAAAEILSALDKGRDDVAATLRAARPRIQAEIIHRLLNRPVREMHQAAVPPDLKLIADVEAILRGVADFGRTQVHDERARQLAGKPAPFERRRHPRLRPR